MGEVRWQYPAGSGGRPATPHRAAAARAIEVLVRSVVARRPLTLPNFLRLYDRETARLAPAGEWPRRDGEAARFPVPTSICRGRLDRAYRRLQPTFSLRNRPLADGS
jgi:hypothetical protein